MLLGKPAMRRTTSMTGISDEQIPNSRHSSSTSPNDYAYSQFNYHLDNHRLLASMVSPRPINRRRTADSCGLCKKRLAAGKDIYMYRGDAAFCSREKQIKKDSQGYAVG